ncbi:MAG: Do family serine endopeptidase [Cytophagales bacterium]|nr:Do family serine endopeptidase [Cytophagales bacterium]
MKTRNLVLAMIFSSVMGGVIAISGYSIFVGTDGGKDVLPVNYTSPNPVSFTNYTVDTTDIAVSGGLNFVHAAKLSTPSVVHIRTTYSSARSRNADNPFEDFYRRYFGEPAPRQDNQPYSRGSGSGVIFTEDGYIVTNNHVIEEADEIEVLLNDNRTYIADVVGVDPTTDLAVIKIQERGLPRISWGDSDNILIGEWVLAVGNPYEFRSTVTAGIVSAKARSINILRSRNRGSNLSIEAFIQTDAAVNPGNSGGALVNLKGELVGINTAIASPTGTFAGYSFAVPVTLVQKVARDLVEFGTVQRALLGVSIVTVNAELSEQEDLGVLKGIYVANVQGNSSAEDAGIEVGDVIVAVDGREVNSVSELQEQVALNRPGDQVEVTYLRDGRRKTTRATLKNSFGTEEVVAANVDVFSTEGAVFVELTGEEKEDLGIENGVRLETLGDGKWKDSNVKEGFVIVKINRDPIEDLEDLKLALARSSSEGMLIEGYYPDGEKAFYGIGW